MGRIRESQIDWNEATGHTHTGTDDEGAALPERYTVVDEDPSPGLYFYGLQHDSGAWFIAKDDKSKNTIRYSTHADNPSLTYAEAWSRRESLVYTLWS